MLVEKAIGKHFEDLIYMPEMVHMFMRQYEILCPFGPVFSVAMHPFTGKKTAVVRQELRIPSRVRVCDARGSERDNLPGLSFVLLQSRHRHIQENQMEWAGIMNALLKDSVKLVAMRLGAVCENLMFYYSRELKECEDADQVSLFA